jgi:hypothetical protein
MKKIQMSRPTPTAGDTTQPTRKRGFNYWSCCHCRLVGGSYLTRFPSLAEQGASKKQGPGTWTCPGLPRTPWRWWRQRNEKRPLPLPLRDRTNPNQPATSSGSGSLLTEGCCRGCCRWVVGRSRSASGSVSGSGSVVQLRRYLIKIDFYYWSCCHCRSVPSHKGRGAEAAVPPAPAPRSRSQVWALLKALFLKLPDAHLQTDLDRRSVGLDLLATCGF